MASFAEKPPHCYVAIESMEKPRIVFRNVEWSGQARVQGSVQNEPSWEQRQEQHSIYRAGYKFSLFDSSFYNTYTWFRGIYHSISVISSYYSLTYLKQAWWNLNKDGRGLRLSRRQPKFIKRRLRLSRRIPADWENSLPSQKKLPCSEPWKVAAKRGKEMRQDRKSGTGCSLSAHKKVVQLQAN